MDKPRLLEWWNSAPDVRNGGALPNAAPPFLERSRISDLMRFGERQCVIDIDAEISNCVFDLGVPQQDLNCPKVASGLVNEGSFCAPKGMRFVFFRAKP